MICKLFFSQCWHYCTFSPEGLKGPASSGSRCARLPETAKKVILLVKVKYSVKPAVLIFEVSVSPVSRLPTHQPGNRSTMRICVLSFPVSPTKRQGREITSSGHCVTWLQYCQRQTCLPCVPVATPTCLPCVPSCNPNLFTLRAQLQPNSPAKGTLPPSRPPPAPASNGSVRSVRHGSSRRSACDCPSASASH